MAPYFECRISKNALLRWFFPLG